MTKAQDAFADPDPTSMLANTPYLIEQDDVSLESFARVLVRSKEAAERFQRTGSRIREEAADVFESFGLTLRSEQVAESNKMEHYEWEPEQVRAIMIENKDLLQQSTHSFLSAIQADDRTYQVLGLAKAHEVVEEWAQAANKPREFEIRELHRLITLGQAYAGRFKDGFNEISGSKHVPPAPADAAQGVRQLAVWWETGSGDAVLDATVVHAWLAHLHPFDDGNGRLARLLANLASSQGKYPPLIIPASTDRGEYYDALEQSDGGNLLPLFTMIERLLRRTEHVMSRPGYVERVIRDRVLTTPERQYGLWKTVAQRFTSELRTALRQQGWAAELQGLPSNSSFSALSRGSEEGNSWYLKILDQEERPRWLLWFGFNSVAYKGCMEARRKGIPRSFCRFEIPLRALHTHTSLCGSTPSELSGLS